MQPPLPETRDLRPETFFISGKRFRRSRRRVNELLSVAGEREREIERTRHRDWIKDMHRDGERDRDRCNLIMCSRQDRGKRVERAAGDLAASNFNDT